MIVFRDMTFCPFFSDCKDGNRCFRALTKEVERQATEARMAVSMFVNPPDCFMCETKEVTDECA
jgi:ATP sulfurylase